MKKNFIGIFVVMLLVLFSCKSTPIQVTYKVRGKIAGFEGKRVVLSSFDKKMNLKPLDTVVIKDSVFEFTIPQQNPNIGVISFLGSRNKSAVIVGDGDVIIKFNPRSPFKSDLTGTTSMLTKKFYDYQLHSGADKGKGMELMQRYRVAQNDQKRDSIKAAFDQWRKDAEKYQYDYVANNKDIVGLIVMQSLLSSRDADFEKIRKSFDTYPEKVRTGNLGLQINKVLLTKGATQIGGKAPNFVGTTPDGKKLSLTQAMGKVTVIDFWASWCRPCRMENPYVVEIYNKYHNQGLNIIGVSLDKNKESWVRAIKDDGLKWQHVSSLKFWKEPIAQMYGVMSVPQTYILDSKGIIRAKNLRRKELEDKIVELLNE